MTGERMIVSRRAFIAVIVGISVAIGLSATAGVLALVLLHGAQQNRVASNVTICRKLNTLSVGLRGFVHDVNPRLSGKAIARFPIEPDCRAYADRQVKPDAP